MEILNYTEFRKNLTHNLNKVNEDAEVVIVSRSKGKNVVVMSLEEYNSMMETMHLMSTETNRKRLGTALAEMEKGKYKKHGLLEK